MYDEKKEWDNVRIRNLQISIARGLKAKEWGSDRTFSESELKQVFRFKVSDLTYYADAFFERSGEMYILSGKEKKYMDKILYANRMAMDFLRDADAKFVAEFGSFHDEYEDAGYGNFSHSRYQKVEESVAELLRCCIGDICLYLINICCLTEELIQNRKLWSSMTIMIV